MQIRTRFTEDGALTVEVIDPSDGAVTHQADLAAGEQIVVTATDTHSPAGIEFGEVEAIAESRPAGSDEPEAAQTDGTASGDHDPEAQAPESEAPDDDEPTAA